MGCEASGTFEVTAVVVLVVVVTGVAFKNTGLGPSRRTRTTRGVATDSKRKEKGPTPENISADDMI